MVLGIALLAGTIATILGALIFADEDAYADCSSPCKYYYERGWPLPWKTNAPGWLIEVVQDGDNSYGANGISEEIFVLSVAMWFVVALAGQALLLFVGSLMGRLLRRQPKPSP